MPGAEEPEEFEWNTWDGTNDPNAVRLIMTHTPAAVGAPGTDTYAIDGIGNLLEAMGLAAGTRHRPSSIIWPRTVFPINGDKRKKRRLDQISEDVPEAQNAISSKFIGDRMNQDKKLHHRQSETFGAGIYNDPIVSPTNTRELQYLNWTGLGHGTHQRNASIVSGLITRAFFDLHTRLNLDILEKQLRDGLVRPTTFEMNVMDFDNEAYARYYFARNQAQQLDPYYGAGGAIAAPANIAPFNGALNAIAHEINNHGLNGTLLNDYVQLQRLVDNRYTNPNAAGPQQNKISVAVGVAMYWYLQVLFQWRKLCYGDAIEHMIATNATTYTTHKNCGGHDEFEKMKKGLYTACLVQQDPTITQLCGDHENRNDLHMEGVMSDVLRNNPRFNEEIKKVINDFYENNEMAQISMNVVNASLHSNNVIRQPNLHINRCRPLTSEREQIEATSINSTSWLLQHIASMMPLTTEMAEPLMKTADTAADRLRVLRPQYEAFLTGNNAGGVPNDSKDYDTFLMHWFMSEFHPAVWVREAAKKICGMNGNETHRITRFMDAMANALENNETFTNELKSACSDIAPGKFDARPVEMVYSIATAAKDYECVRKWNTNKNLHVNTCQWFETPVDCKKQLLMQSDVQTNSVFSSVNGLNENCEKAVKKGCAKYHHADISARLGALYNPESIPQNSQKYFDVGRKNIHQVQTGDDLINLSHPWTNFIPNGIEALSSTTFPIDWQYRANQTNPESAGQKVYSDNNLRNAAHAAAESCRSSPQEAMREVLMILFTRFFKPAARFMNDGAGVAVTRKGFNNGRWNYSGYAFAGCHLKHGPFLPETSNSSGKSVGNAQDIVILRPNIEHEMLGIIMGRGGTQELGATFWGQTELSCYDDAQHGTYQSNFCMSCPILCILLIHCVINRYLGHELQVSFE